MRSQRLYWRKFMDKKNTEMLIIRKIKDMYKDKPIPKDPSEIITEIENEIFNLDFYINPEDIDKLINTVYSKLFSQIGILNRYVNDININEIMVNGKDNLFFEKNGEIKCSAETFDSTAELEEIIRTIASQVHREINEMNPILDARLSDGSRVNAVMKNIAVNGPVLTIRKFPKDHFTVNEMIKFGTVTTKCAQYLKILVESGYNIFISGGTSSGKTSFLNALSDYIPISERVIVIEDSTELNLSSVENLIQMECHNANTAGQGKVSMDMLIKTSLRMRPDRIIVGEVRGKEVADMLQAMNTGHSGSMSTGHGNSVSGMLRRLEAMYLMSAPIPLNAIRAQIVEGIDIMIHLGKLKNGKRKILEIQEIIGYEHEQYILNPLFLIDDKFNLTHTGNRIKNRSKLILYDMEGENELL